VSAWNAALFVMVNRFAMATGWLHGVGVAYAADGLVVFAVLLLAGWWSARERPGMAAMAAALWAPLGMLLALGINQFLVALVAEPRPYAVLDHPLLLVAPTLDPALPADHSAMAGAARPGCGWRGGASARWRAWPRWQGQSMKPPAHASQEPSGPGATCGRR
jgi:hypothetical protein